MIHEPVADDMASSPDAAHATLRRYGRSLWVVRLETPVRGIATDEVLHWFGRTASAAIEAMQDDLQARQGQQDVLVSFQSTEEE